MSEFFLELFSEEIPSKLQIDARTKIKILFEDSLKKKNIKFNLSKSFSTPKRLVIYFNGMPKKISQKEKILKGPKVGTPPAALEGFLKTNNLDKKNLYEKSIDKGKFYFAKTKPKNINVLDEMKQLVPQVLKTYSWKKTMRWSDYELNWARPLKSIIALFDSQLIDFKFYHLYSSHDTFLGQTDEESTKIINYKFYLSTLKSHKIILDQDSRKKFILSKFKKICSNKNLKEQFNQHLIEEVTNLVETPNIIVGRFNEIFLKIPNEILTTTMQHHQKFFPLFDLKNKLTSSFLIVANVKDLKGLVKSGNERVIAARLSDAKFFWERNKSQSLVKQVGKLKKLSFFNRLGTVFDKTQRLRKIGSLISDQLNINKEKIEIACSICKSDLVSDLINEYPELQGVMGKYFAFEQGFDVDICQAIGDHYLPVGLNSSIPKKPISYAVALADKIDNLVGFFGINEKPTSSKDPFALRRSSIGLLRIIIENNLNLQLNDLINYTLLLYEEQNIELPNKSTPREILDFLSERIKNLLKDKKIRLDIIEAAISSHVGDNFLLLYKKCSIINKNISKDLGKDIIGTYKRASNILSQEARILKQNIEGNPNTVLFKEEEEKFLFEKINEIRKYLSSTIRKENYDQVIEILADAKLTTDNFFNKVTVNDKNLDVKKNRLELLKMFCNTYNNFIDFSKVEGA